jgi:predicted Rossmann-fold nucleotide-binding protein
VTASAIVGEHKKPVIIVNENGFYDDLISLITRMKTEMFIPVENYKPMIVSDIQSCVDVIEQLKK